MSLLAECLAAHGGADAFARLDRVRLRLRCSGLALRMKLRSRALVDVHAVVDLRNPAVVFDGLGRWDAADVRPPRMPWRFPWTDRDVAFFAGYALWNYVAAPFLWTRCETRELPGRRLALTFPYDVPTHCRHQVAHLDATGLVRRLDYTAEVFGPWARAANECLEYASCGRIVVPSRRRVTPRGLRGPTLIALALDELEVSP